jgi:4-hydroxybenzoate polyprenyltransferase
VARRTARTKIRRAATPLRAGEWWEHKLAPMLGTGYMTAFHVHSALLDVWPTLFATLIGMAAAAGYVSLVNDLTDLDEDSAAGKCNRLAQRGPRYRYGAVCAVLVVGVAVAVVAWRQDLLALALYAGPWVAFSLYSFPPVRLKARGAAGALADASGAHLFPNLLIAAAVFHASGRRLEWPWLSVVGVWALAAGIRGALWHQLGDVEADKRSGVPTFGALHPRRARASGRAAFAIELAAFSYLLVRAGSPLPFVLLIPYVLLELARMRLWDVRLIVVSPAPDFRIAMHEYYLFFFPLAFLIASVVRHPSDLAVLFVHTAIFRETLPVIVRDARNAHRTVAGLRTAKAPPDRPGRGF